MSSAIVRRGRTGAVTVAVAAGLALVVAGCKADAPTSEESPTATASPSPTPSVEEQQARDGALAAYTNYLKLYVDASNKGDYNAKLDKYTANPALLNLKADLLKHYQLGLVTKGQPGSSPKVLSADTTKRPFLAKVEDCFDLSSWSLVNKKTGKPAQSAGQATRYVVTAEAVLADDGQWRIRQINSQRERPC